MPVGEGVTGWETGMLAVAHDGSVAAPRVRGGMPVGNGARAVATGISSSLPVASAGGSILGASGVLLSVSQKGITETVADNGIRGALMSSDATGLTTGGGKLWLFSSVAFEATEG
jgi:hypothetical protein